MHWFIHHIRHLRWILFKGRLNAFKSLLPNGIRFQITQFEEMNRRYDREWLLDSGQKHINLKCLTIMR